MGELKPQKGADLITFLYGQGGQVAIPKPFEQEIFLFRTHVAGTTHVEGMDELAPSLSVGEKLNFFREPETRMILRPFSLRMQMVSKSVMYHRRIM